MATIYGTEIGLDDNAMIAALLVTQFIGVPFAFLFGMFAGKVGAKPAVFVGLAEAVREMRAVMDVARTRG